MAISFSDVLAKQSELSYVAPQNFYLHIDRLPDVVFLVQQVQLPSLSAGEAELSNRQNSGRVFIPGDTLDYGTLDVTFLLDKHLKSYRSILDWMKGFTAPETGDQFSQFERNFTINQDPFADTMSDMTLFASDASNSPLSHWSFKNAFPISLDGFSFDATMADVEYLAATTSFRFTYFEHQTYNNGSLNDDLI